MLSLALGIGANLAVLTLVSHTLLRRLPYDDPGQLVAVGVSRSAGLSWSTMSYNYVTWNAASATLSGVTWVRDGASGFVVGNSHDRLVGAIAASNLLQVLRVRPAIGRWFTADEARQGEAVAVLSHAVWQTRFEGRRDVIGRRLLRVDGRLVAIVGVLPPGAGIPTRADFWYPRLDLLSMQVVGRMRDGVSVQVVQQELAVLASPAAAAPSPGMRFEVVVTSLQDRLYGAGGLTLRIFLVGAFLVFVLACTNVATLCLMRALRRQHELAVFLALGASRRQIGLQAVAENAILSIGATVGAVVLSVLVTDLLVRFSPPDLAESFRGARPDFRVILIAIALAIGAVLLISWAPLLASARVDLRPMMAAAFGSTMGRRLRSCLVVAQLTIALVLVTACGLLSRSMIKLTRIDVGFDRHGLILAQLQFLDSSESRGPLQRATAEELARSVGLIRGVRSAGLGPPPLVGGRGPKLSDGYSTIVFVNDSTKTGAPRESIWIKYVDALYLETFQIEIRKGRGITPGDDQRSPAVAILNATAERLLFPDGSALGRRLDALPKGISAGRPVTVIGVVGDVRQRDITIPASPEIWLPIAQQQQIGSAIYVSARTDGNVESITRAVRTILPSLGQSMELRRVTSIDAVVREALAPQRFVLSAFLVLASLALVLATVGVYAVIAYLTASRTREIGVRIALGAPRLGVVWMVVSNGIRLAVFGVVAALPITFVWGNGLTRFLYEVEPWDLTTIAASVAVLMLAATAAALVPARRAARIDPALALRLE